MNHPSSPYHSQVVYLQNKRQENMDRYLLEQRTLLTPSQEHLLQLFLVCDGVGSTRRGGIVAQQVSKSLLTWFRSLETCDKLWEQFARHVRSINDILYQKERDQRLPRGATTFSGLLTLDDQFFIIHLGDSRIFARQADGWLQLTEDHVIDGAVTEVIPRPTLHPLCFGGDTRQFSHFFLATDGFYRRLDWGNLDANLSQFPHNSQYLPDLAQEIIDKGEKDNMTGILLCRS